MCNNCNYYAEIDTMYGKVCKCQKTKRLLSEHDKKKRPECYVKRGVEDEQGKTIKSN